MKRLAHVLSVAVIAVVGVLVLLMEVETALHKGFWIDEGYEIVTTCGKPLHRMVLEGARECSPAPLYWLVQSVVIRSVGVIDLSVRVKYRAVSLAAATLTIIVLLLGLRRRLGLAAALVAAASLLTQPSFHHYAAQNRAYMTWVLVTTLLALAASLVPPGAGGIARWRQWTLLGAGALAGLVAVPGGGQALAAFAAGALAWRALEPPGPDRRTWILLGGGALAILALDAHYWSGSVCRAYTGAGHLDVLGAGVDRASLVRQVVSLVWPDPSFWGWPGQVAAVLGVMTPLILWRRRARLDGSSRFALGLALAALSQLLVAVPVALGLAAGHYLFLPRMFIFLVVARALLVGVGFFTATAWVENTCPARARRFVSVALVCIALAVTWHALTVAEDTTRSWRYPLPPVAGVSCEALGGSSAQVLHRPQDHDFAFTPNFLARAGAALGSCPSGPATAKGARYLLALDAVAATDWVALADTHPPGFESMLVCGAPVSLGPGGRLLRETAGVPGR